MAKSAAGTRNVEVDHSVATYANDAVPDKWKSLFTNDEWFMHDIVVKTTYGFLAIAVVAHALIWMWRPWLTS